MLIKTRKLYLYRLRSIFSVLQVNLSLTELGHWYLPSSPSGHRVEVCLQEIPHKLELMPQLLIVSEKGGMSLEYFVFLVFRLH